LKLFIIYNFVPFEICSEYETVLKFFINRRKLKKQKNKNKKEKKAPVDIGPVRSKYSLAGGKRPTHSRR
jgi:hypothetical protein